MTALLLAAPVLSLAQNVVFVNTDAPGVHKEYDSKRGCYVWKNGMGGYICKDKEMKSIWEMDKHVYFNGANGDADNPQAANSSIRKVWDKNRGCYVWKNIYTGDFLGTDKKSVEQQEQKKAKELAEKKKKEQEAAKKQQKEKEKTHKEQKKDSQKEQKQQQKQQNKKNTYDQDIQKSEKMLITTDEQMREAEAALREVKAQMAEAQAEGIDLSGYGIEGYIKEIEDAINEYKRTRNKMK